jgi:hypothetical protein
MMAFADLLVIAGVVLMIDGGSMVLAGAIIFGGGILLNLFAVLTVRVDGSHVSATFTFGFPNYRIALSEIESVTAVRNKSWWGIGLRKIPGGWMYNVWGLDAVELTRTGASVFRIGTDDPSGLANAINVSRS